MNSRKTWSHFLKTECGFSLMELFVVIGIIAVTTLIAVPAYNLTIAPTARLNGASRQLFSDIQFVRLRAISENERYGLAFATGSSYIIFIDNNADSQRNGGDEDVRTVDLADEYPRVSFDTSKGGGDGIGFAYNSFAFSPRAVATNGGSVFLLNEKGQGREIAVNTMGGVRLAEY